MPFKHAKKRFKSALSRRGRRKFHGRRVGRKSRGNTSGTLPSLNTRNAQTVQRGLLPFGTSYLCKLPYVFNVVLTTAANDLATSHRFRLGSLFDPDLTGSGHQPYQFDQLTLMYSRYMVYGVKYSITFSNPDVDGVYCGLVIRNSTAVQTDPDGKKFDFIQEKRMAHLLPINNSGSQRRTVKGYISNAQVAGLTKKQYAAEYGNYGSLSTQNPLLVILMHLVTINPGALVSNIRATGTLTYYAKLSEYFGVGQSS